MLPLIHFLHLLLGITWWGGTLLMAVAVFPALARRPAAEAQATLAAISRVALPVLSLAGGLTGLLGPLRAWVGGGITEWRDFAYPYAWLVVAAFLIVWIVVSQGGSFRRRFEALLSDPPAFAATAPALAARHAAIQVVLLLAILCLMVALGLGLY